jgi:polyhydroxyalkanoate synthase
MNEPHWSSTSPAKTLFEQMDRLRWQRGKMLDAAGFGPLETPYEVVHEEEGVSLRRYGEQPGQGPTLLIVPAPIKRPYIWDLQPEFSVVRRCLERGMRVYLAAWTPVEPAAGNTQQEQSGLADYADRLIGSCLAAIRADGGNKQAILAGHSLGGVLAVVHAALHPQQVQALLLLESPLHFGADAGNFAPLVAATPDAAPIGAAFGNVPGSFLNLVSAGAAPRAFQWERLMDLSLSAAHPRTFATHMRVERWSHDEFPLPGKLFTDIVERLYRHDELMDGKLDIGGRKLGPKNVKAPMLNVLDPRSSVVPPQSILPFHKAAASAAKMVLHYEGDVGVGIQHVGVLVGSRAHAVVWPAIFDWLSSIDVLRD